MEDYQELIPGATACVKEFANITKEDKVLIITDKTAIAEALAKVSKDVGVEEVLVFYLPRVMRPLKQLSEALKSLILESTVVFTPFDSMEGEVHFRTEIVNLAGVDDGRKIVHMPSVTPKMFSGHGMLALKSNEIEIMTKLTEKLAILLSAAKEIRIKSASQEETELCMNLGGWGHSGIVSTGHVMKGSWGNLPSGEAFVLPKKGTASGTIVIDKAIAGIPSNELPVTLKVTNGIIELDNITNGKRLKDLLKNYSDDARTVCEFGIGTNPKSTSNNGPIEIEKMLKTIHIAIGTNAIFGGDIRGTVPHIDMVISEPTVEVDYLQSDAIVIIEGGHIKEDRIDAFFKVHYKNFSDKISDSARVKIISEVGVDEDKEDMLYRCWKDYRGHKLCVAVGNDDTARKAKEVWSCIDSSHSQNVNKILKQFNLKYGGDSKLACQLLCILEKFGLIEIESSGLRRQNV
jgi:hypothetical protein